MSRKSHRALARVGTGMPRRRWTSSAAILALFAAGFSVVSAPAQADPPSSVVEQHWEVLDKTKLGLLGTTTFPIQRGALPGGTSKFDPQPTASFEVSARVSTGTGSWKVQLHDGSSLIAEVTFSSASSSYGLQTASLTWPSSDRTLAEIRTVQSFGGTRVLDIRKAYVKITQSGTVKKTVGRNPIATRQTVTNTSMADVADTILYSHEAGGFDPAPTVWLRVTGRLNSGIHGAFQLVDNEGNIAPGSADTFESTTITSLTVGPVELGEDRRYRLQVAAAGGLHLVPNWDLYSADLVFEQSTTASTGIVKTVGWYPGVSDPCDITTDGQALGFRFKTPTLDVEDWVATWELGVTRLTGTNELGVDLVQAGGTTPFASSVAVANEGTPEVTIAIRKPVDLPAAGTTLDARTVVGTGSTGRVSNSVLRIAMTLPDLEPPVALAFEAYPNPFSPDSDAPRDEATITATLLEDLPWTLTIREPDDTLVRSFTGSGPDVLATWDGTDALNQRVADGAYKIGLSATDAAGNEMMRSRWLTVGPAPTIIDVEEDNIQLGSKITIQGEAFGDEGLGNFGVTVNGENAIVDTWSDSEITAWLPPGLEPGTAEVNVWQADLTGSTFDIEISKAVYAPVGADIFEGRISVRLANGTDPEDVADRMGDPPGAITRSFPGSSHAVLERWYDVDVQSGTERERADDYATDAEVEVAQVTPMGSPPSHTLPNDPRLLTNQWALRHATHKHVNAEEAWGYTIGSASVEIGLLDRGIGPHEDIDANLIPGGAQDPTNCDGHGTAVAGVAAADTNNGTGIAGLGWKTRIRGYRIWSATTCSYEGNLANRIASASADGRHVLILSFASPTFDKKVEDAAKAAWKAGVVLVAAAGNTNNDCLNKICYPAHLDDVIAVGALDQDGKKASFSNSKDIEVWAPGVDIRTTLVSGGYGDRSGTSYASPHVAAGAGLLLSLDGQTNQTVRNAIANNTTGSPKRLDIGKAIQARTNRMYPLGTWIKSHSGPSVWLIDRINDNNVRRPAVSQVYESWGVSIDDVVTVSDAELGTWKRDDSQRVGFRPGTLIARGTPTLLANINTSAAYLVSNENADSGQHSKWLRGDKYLLLGTAQNCLGFNPKRIKVVDAELFGWHLNSQNQDSLLGWTNCSTYPNGAIVRTGDAPSNYRYWMIQNGLRREFGEREAATVRGSWAAAADAAPRQNYAAGGNGTKLGYRFGTVLRVQGPLKRWVIVPGTSDWGAGWKRDFAGTFGCYGYPKEVVPEQKSYVNQLHPADGSNMPC